MKPRILTLVLISFIFLRCSGQQGDLNKICAEIRNTPQVVWPNVGKDKKVQLIRKLKNINAEATCDSLKTIFLSIDTSKRGYWDYKFEPLYILSEFNTAKSLTVLSEILRDYNIDFPANMYFIWDLVYKTENIHAMFPNLAKSLGFQSWTDKHVLMIIVNAYKKGDLTKEQLESSKNYLIAFYDYLKKEKDSLHGSKHYGEYYDANITELLYCLRIFDADEKINAVYQDVLKLNIGFPKFCSVGFVDYNNKSKRKIAALYQAALGLAQNNQPVDEKYLELIVAEPLYHNNFYNDLLKLNKQSLFPKKYLSQDFFAISDLAYSKESSKHDGLPDCLELLGKREIKEGTNKGVYYFYNSKMGSKNDININISGPQPLTPTEFTLKGSKTNKTFIELSPNGSVESKIDARVKELTAQ